MLVLTRRPGERIRIGDDIEITVMEVHRDTVRISIQAPREVRILRQEIYERVTAMNSQAAKVTEDLLVSLTLPVTNEAAAGAPGDEAPGSSSGDGPGAVTAAE